MDQEMDMYIRTGNCQPIVGKIVCINPTLLESESSWNVYYLVCPFDAYFPVPVIDQLASENGFVTTSAYNYCKSKLQSILSDFNSRKHRVRFNFYFGDCLELCLGEKLINKCEVIHCSNMADRAGLANIILTAGNCLSENPESYLVTDTADWAITLQLQDSAVRNGSETETIAEYIKLSLSCDISMIPTLYGLRLANHVNLGSPFCVQLHDFTSTSRITLKWLRAPTYSDNVKLEVSSVLEALQSLANSCFVIKSEDCDPQDIANLPYSPLTFYYFLWSLRNRCRWSRNQVESLLMQIVVPPSFQLEWKAQQSWMKGDEVLHLTIPYGGTLFRCISLEKKTKVAHIQLMLVSDRDMVTHRAEPETRLPEEFFAYVKCIENFCWSRSQTSYMLGTKDLFKDPANPSLSFILPKDHGLEATTHLCLVDLQTQELLFSLGNILNPNRILTFLKSITHVLVNPTPWFTNLQAPTGGATDIGLQIQACIESPCQYKLEFATLEVAINKLNGIIFSYFCF